MGLALLDTDTLSEIMKGRHPHVREKARQYLADHARLTLSIITRYEILHGLKAKQAIPPLVAFAKCCDQSLVLPLTDESLAKQPISTPSFAIEAASSVTQISWSPLPLWFIA